MDKVEFILPGSPAVFKKCRYIKVMWLSYILAPRSGKPKTPEPADGRQQAGAGDLSRFCQHEEPRECDLESRRAAQ
ncbi:hypothetical protein ABWH93_06015 [Seohaeicola saemankumensis]|uniref:hypothetical protein n=1 Tax=Seohaeicola saemankumensis TaxID=481181 RepID=UPI0035D051CB